MYMNILANQYNCTFVLSSKLSLYMAVHVSIGIIMGSTIMQAQCCLLLTNNQDITVSKIYVGEAFCQILGQIFNFTAMITVTHCRKTLFLIVYSRIYLPKLNF